MTPQLLRRVARRLRSWALRAAHELLIARLRLERGFAALLTRTSSPRVVATACSTFPIYSQTFVHQEVIGLARSGFSVRFLYTQLGPRSELAHHCDDLWPLKRRVLLHAELGAADLAAFRRRMPDKVEELTALVANAARLPRDQVEGHEHFLHAFSFARAVEAWNPDYLHSYFFYERTLFALVASYLLGIPRGISCYADHLLNDYPFKIVPLHLRTSDVIVATSQRIRTELEELHGGALSAVVVKPNAIDASEFPTKIRPRVRAGEPLQLVCVNRIDPKKGIEFLVEAVRLLIDEGLSVEAHIVGAPDGHSPESQAYHEALRRHVAELGLGRIVRFAGQRDSREIMEFLNKADVFIASSVELASGDKDGIPTAVLEAMATGCVVVATNAGSIGEVINDGLDGLLVPQRDAPALAAAVRRLARDQELAGRLASAAATRARRDFNILTSDAAFHRRVRAAIDEQRVIPEEAGALP